MKKVLMIVAAIALFAGSVNAGPQAFIGIYADEARSLTRVDVPAPYMGWTTWIWVQPSDLGMICSEFMVTNPPWVLNTGTVVNPAHSVALGDPFTGYSICFGTCNLDWTWLVQLSALPTAAGTPGFVNIVAHPDAGAFQVANCEDGYPIESLILLNNLGINQDAEFAIGTETSSWGAIKSMVSE